MSGEVTLCFYLVIGAGVAFAIFTRAPGSAHRGQTFRVFTAFLFWPFYLPILLTADGPPVRGDVNQVVPVGELQLPPDEMSSSISQVESELDAALCSLNGWAEETLCAEADRFAELRAAWHQQAANIRELDRLLAASDSDAPGSPMTSGTAIKPDSEFPAGSVNSDPPLPFDPSSAERIITSEQSRRDNLLKLKLVRQRWHSDLLATLAWVRQLVTMIHLARYTGEPASRAAELVQQIAKAVEGLSKERVSGAE